MLHTSKETHNPLVSPEEAEKLQAFRTWNNGISKTHPSIISEVFGTPRISKAISDRFLLRNQDEYSYLYSSDALTNFDDISTVLPKFKQNTISKKKYLPLNLYEPPITSFTRKGNCLRTFYSVSGKH